MLPAANVALAMFAVLVLASLLLMIYAPRGSLYARGAPGAFIAMLLMLSVMIGREVVAMMSRRELRRLAADTKSRDDEAAAIRHVAATRGRRTARPVDAGQWLATFGPGALTLGVSTPPREAGVEPVSEPVDVGPGRRRRRLRERRIHWSMFLACVLLSLAFALSMLSWLLSGASPSVHLGSGLFTPLAMLPMFLAVAAQLGYRPIELTSVIAEPARVLFTSWGRTVAFTRDDSVLVIEPARWMKAMLAIDRDSHRAAPSEPVAAWLVRRDGRCWVEVYQGHDDPGLCDLYHRWMAVAESSDRAVRTHAATLVPAAS